MKEIAQNKNINETKLVFGMYKGLPGRDIW